MDVELTVSTETREYDGKRGICDISYHDEFLSNQPTFLVYDSAFKSVLGSSPKISLIQKQPGNKFAHEAGIYIKSTNKNYFTSNYQSGRTVDIFSVDCEPPHKITKLAYPSVVNGNGGCHYQDKLLFCSQGSWTVPSALVLVDPATEEGTTMINNFHGREFNSINDVVIHHETGDVWFTDPTYGFEQAFRPSPLLPSQVYRFRPSTGQVWCVADGFAQCNGLCFSPDYERMYITDTGALQAHGTPGSGSAISVNPRLPASIYLYDVVEGGMMLANRRVFAYCGSGVPDGIKCDVKGNVYSGCGDGIQVWDPVGTLIGKIFVNGVVANFNFSKGGIWAMAEEKLFHVEIAAKGALAKVEGH